MTAAPATLARDLSGRRLGRYEVLGQLASGGMATVYVARAQGVAGFERLVAIKVLHPHLAHDEDFVSMFLDEARLAARIRHPNVVPTLDISDSEGDGYFLVMEYIEGDHLGALLREAARAQSPVPIAIAARLVIDALEGLGAAHALTDADGQPLGIVHRDVSPHNVLIGVDGVARITDFGVARAEVRLSSTRDGQFKGKLAYMAPEQASNGRADRRSDLFSMGIVLWETLTGRRLFRADSNGELLHRLLHEPIAAPSRYVPHAALLDAVCARALARDPAARFQSAAEFVDAIEDAMQTGGVASPRAAGRLVRELLGPKIDGQNARIREATDALGRSEVGSFTHPTASGIQPALPSTTRAPLSLTPSAIRPVVREDRTMGAKPSTVASDPGVGEGAPAPPRRSRRTLAALALLAMLLLGSAAAFAFVQYQQGAVAEMRATPLEEASPPAAVAPTEVAPAAGSPFADTPAEPAPGEGAAATAPEPRRAARAADESSVARDSSDRDSIARREHESAPSDPDVEPHRRRDREAEDEGAADDEVLLNPYRR